MERTPDYFKVWFWSRHEPDVPYDVRNSLSVINPIMWGPPVAFFPTNPMCDLDSKFGPANIIINLTLCGDWAGDQDVYAKSGCPGTCVGELTPFVEESPRSNNHLDFVNNNPQAFQNAYFDFKSILVYE